MQARSERLLLAGSLRCQSGSGGSAGKIFLDIMRKSKYNYYCSKYLLIWDLICRSGGIGRRT